MATARIMATFGGMTLREVQELDGTEFHSLHEQVPRIQAERAMALVRAISAGMNGGDFAVSLLEDLQRQASGAPKTRLTAEWEQLSMRVFGPRFTG